MVKGKLKPTPANSPAEVVYDPSAALSRKPRRPGAPSASSEWHSFMAVEKPADTSDDEPDIGKLLKDVELFGVSTFKERKKIENRRVVELGGKAVKKHRPPLSVAKPALKNQKKREQRKIDELWRKCLGCLGSVTTRIANLTRLSQRSVFSGPQKGISRMVYFNVKHLMGPPET